LSPEKHQVTRYSESAKSDSEIEKSYGGLDRLDCVCLGVRFKCSLETIIQDFARADEALKAERQAEKRAAVLAQERATELALAREILKRGGV
jgi:hypothetical protein